MPTQSNKVPQSRKQKVLSLLRSNRRRWTPGTVIASPEVGGSEGLRRVRELRADGFAIERRRMDGSTAYEYRLAK